jgi:hypothetical protein
VAVRQQLDLLQAMVDLRRDLLNLAKIRVQLGPNDTRAMTPATAELEAVNKREAGYLGSIRVLPSACWLG